MIEMITNLIENQDAVERAMEARELARAAVLLFRATRGAGLGVRERAVFRSDAAGNPSSSFDYDHYARVCVERERRRREGL
jgi:hypothetical protein